jgi:hypothetical protein
MSWFPLRRVGKQDRENREGIQKVGSFSALSGGFLPGIAAIMAS